MITNTYLINSSTCQLKIPNWIRINIRYTTFHFWKLTFNNIIKYLRRKLLTLIMSNNTNLYLLLMTKELMITHFASHESISTGSNSLIQEKCTRTSTAMVRISLRSNSFV